jgi:acetyltransferase
VSTDDANGHFSTDSVQKKYSSERTLKNGVSVVFRPIECTDQARFKDFFKNLSPATVHYRFLEIIKELPNETIEKYCNLDYNREMAIVALPKGDSKIVAVVRLMVDREEGNGEFALVVADAWQGVGLGAALLEDVIQIAGDYGLLELHCTVSSDNLRMVGLAEKFGLKVKSSDGDTVEMTLGLG